MPKLNLKDVRVEIDAALEDLYKVKYEDLAARLVKVRNRLTELETQASDDAGVTVTYGEYGQRQTGGEVTVPTKDAVGSPCLATVAIESWVDIGGTAEVVEVYRVDPDTGERKDVLGGDERWERGIIRQVIDAAY